MDTVKYCIVKNVSVNPVIFDWVHYMKRLVKYFLFCALNNHKIEILCFFPYPEKVCGTILKSIITIQGYLCENLYRRNLDMQNILVVEDDYDLNQAICYSLKKSGYGVYGVTFMEKGKQIFFENQIDMVLLDVNLPDGEGFSFCQWVKKQREVPVIYLTARDMEEDALAGYESGAEDYVTKPFSMKILLRKIEVILKRTASVNRLIFADEYLYIDLDNARVTVKGQECPVTPTECRLLRQFLMNRGQLLTYDLLLERLWDSGGQFVDKHTLAVNVNRLRGKIEDKNHRYISNVYGMGYQWIG